MAALRRAAPGHREIVGGPAGAVCSVQAPTHLSVMVTGSRLAYRTVLVVDADAARGGALVAALVRRGMAATAVPAAHLALRLATARPPDAWVVDHALPGVSGAQLVAMLRASANLALRGAVMIGIAADARARGAFAAAGIDAFLAEPEEPEVIAAAVEAALTRPQVAEGP